MQPIKSEYIHLNPFTGQYIYDACTIISESDNRCKIEVQVYSLNDAPKLVVKNVKKTSVRYYIELMKVDSANVWHRGSYFD